MKPLGLLTALICAVRVLSAQGTADDFFRVIRSGDLDGLRTLAAKSEVAGVRNGTGATPLHYAATYGSTEAVRLLLDRGANPNARNNAEITPLILAAYSLEKTRLLVEKGGDVNAHARDGVTPLMVAAAVHGNAATVKYLLEKGADPRATRANGGDALQTAAFKSEPEAVGALLGKGADARRADDFGVTALIQAFLNVGDPESVRLLIAAGSDVNAFNTKAGQVKNGPVTTFRLTPLAYAAPTAGPSTIGTLLRAGAHVNSADARNMTPLMLAVAADYPKMETVRQMIAAGADVNAKDLYGDSVLDWALKFRNPDVLAPLRKAGAKAKDPAPAPVRPADYKPAGPADAIARSLALMAKSGETFFREGGGCVGCHHQALNARAYAAVRAAGLKPEERIRQTFLDSMTAERAGLLTELPLMLAIGGDFDTLLYEIVTLGDLGEPASPSTDAIVHYLAARQSASGAWARSSGPRTPMESSVLSSTAWAVRALKTYPLPARQKEFDERIARARAWLLTARPVTTYEQADRLMALRIAGASDADVSAAGRALLKLQKDDGGWTQTPYLDTDPYATGVVLHTLYEAGVLKPSDAAYQRGVAYLLRTQFPDGSWYVRSRSPKLQPYFQSAFPYEHDQWISAAATARAVMALAPAGALETRAAR